MSFAPGDAPWNVTPIFLPVTGTDNILSAPLARPVTAVALVLLILLAAVALRKSRQSAQ